MSSGRNTNHIDQDDTDLSFEALTFGGSNEHNELSPSDSPVHRKENKSKKSPNVRSPVEQEKEKGTTSVYISTQGENKIDVQALLKRVELFGTVKAHYFREKQNFGFVQFLDHSAVDAVIDDLNRNGVDGVPILAEKAVASKASGRASPTSVGGTPFSPSTPITPSVHAFLSSTPNGTSLFSANNAALLPQVGPEKPDTILVLKNLPFSLKQDQLQEILMQMNSNAPQSINLHFDNLGVFRGMAFIKYRNLDDAIKVFDNLNGYDVGGRKVRVEYKRKNKGQPSDVPQEWIDDDDLRKLWEQVKEFSANPNLHEVSLSSHLNQTQRKQIHAMADKLKLTHFSNGDGEQRHICLKKNPSPSPVQSPHPLASPHMNGSVPVSPLGGVQQQIHVNGHGGGSVGGNNNHMMNGSIANGHGTPGNNGHGNHVGSAPGNNGQYLSVDSGRGGIEIKGRRRQNSDAMKGSSPSGSFTGGSSVEKYRGAGSYNKKEPSTPTAADNHMDWRSPPPASPTSNQAPQQPFASPLPSPQPSPSLSAAAAIAPVRQPKGPDGSKGFTDIYKESRKTCASQVGSVVLATELSTSVST